MVRVVRLLQRVLVDRVPGELEETLGGTGSQLGHAGHER